jgi:hypothetical protein
MARLSITTTGWNTLLTDHAGWPTNSTWMSRMTTPAVVASPVPT